MNAFAAREHGEANQSQIGQLITNIGRGALHIVEVQPLVGVEIENHAVWSFDIRAARPPAVEFDRPHLNTLQNTAFVFDVEIIFSLAVFVGDRHMVDTVTERTAIMLLKETLFRAALRTTNEANRALVSKG